MLKSIMKNRLRRFLGDTEGYVTIEAMIVMPALLWLFGVGWVYFDVFRQQSVNQKANYVIGDMISRETDPITDTYINNSTNLLYTLNKSQGTESDLRITVIRYDSRKDNWQVVWSEARGDYLPLKGWLTSYRERLPIAAHQDQLIVVETWDDYNPVFQVGLDAFEITTYSFTRPRYAPQVLFTNSEDNNGWGNGDQDAPGGSLCTNNAENAIEGSLAEECNNDDGSQNIEPANNGNGKGGGGGNDTASAGDSGGSSGDDSSYSAPPPPPPPPPPPDGSA